MTLLIGYGNPGRGDDGLGPAFAERIAKRALPGLTVEVDYQLTVEHAVQASGHSSVVFVDAALSGHDAYRMTKLSPASAGDVSSHSLSPATILGLAANLYAASPEAHVLAITGKDFDRVHEGLSPQARANLDRAEAYFADWYARSAEPVLG